jgi:RNA polymerase sigma factor (sigma-70 family)
MQPPAEGLASRLFLVPALRTQPDRRLVALVREGYETAFEEIVRRYGKPLSRYAASIVGGRSDDVLQDAFSRALLALRRDDAEIELRPWLFRIVRNTALNDLRDRPPSPEALAESLVSGGGNPSEELERREELADLMRRLRALPEAQRAAIVMRELEGLSHEEIAAALGMTGGAARQAIYRARRALRDGIGMLVPLPLLHSMLAVAATPGAGETAAGVASVGGAAGAGMGAGMALKATAATVLVAGAVGAGVAVERGQRVDKAEAGAPLARDARESGATPTGSEPGRAGASDGTGQGSDDRSATGHRRGGHGEGGESGHASGRGPDGPGRSGLARGEKNSGSSGGRDGGHGEDGDDHVDRHGSLSDDRSGHGGPGTGGDRRGHDDGDRDGFEPENDSHSGPGSGDEELEQVSGSDDGADAPAEQIVTGGGGGDGGIDGGGSGSGSGSQLDGHSGSGDSSGSGGLTE